MGKLGRAWAIRNTDTGDWYTRTPWWDGTNNVIWSPNFNDAYTQKGEVSRGEVHKQARWLKTHGHNVEVVRLAFVEDPHTFKG